MALTSLTWSEANGRRLRRHGLTAPLAVGGPAAAAAAMCGAHAQVLSAAEVSIALRLSGGTREDVRRALEEERTLVKTFGPRGTVHLLPAADLALWCGALGAVPVTARQPAGARLTAERTERLVEAIGAVLSHAELTVDELTEALADRLGAWAVDPVVPAFRTMWPRWRQATEIAARRGVLCFGPDKGRKVTYTHPARLLPGFSPAPSSEAVAWLLRRYLHAYGPATPDHFARWLATAPAWSRDRFDGGDLTEVSFEGARAWVGRGDTEAGDPARGILLLPRFDAFAVGSRPRELLYPGRARDRALSRGQAGNRPVVLIDGTVAGVWHQKKTAGTLAVTVEPFAPLTARRRGELDEQVRRLGAVLGVRPTLTVGAIAVGAHA
ncbi:winged helix DNA-binding domain-containing protein [Streptomyces sp. NE5-10]|uniref:winged helix DNA-binding domain-containing protein n=1 Tax=Streptomyces sp. NE5-10 TaxID=2759674 RepID=UPI001906C2B8|nr:winged helix DNA-binding domain-containing protein [Streptomyces sp. NE5-10]